MSTLADDNDETLCELLSLRLDDLDLSGTMVAPDELNLAEVSIRWQEWTHESAGPSALGMMSERVLCMDTGDGILVAIPAVIFVEDDPKKRKQSQCTSNVPKSSAR
jgi:hypothetical protein